AERLDALHGPLRRGLAARPGRRHRAPRPPRLARPQRRARPRLPAHEPRDGRGAGAQLSAGGDARLDAPLPPPLAMTRRSLAHEVATADHAGVTSARLRLLPGILAVLWAALVWELCTSTRVTHGHWYWWTPWAFNLAHAPLFGMQAALLGLALAPGAVEGGWRRLLRAVPE